jgi:hypothetical protein
MPLTYSINAELSLITITGEYAAADEWRTLLARLLTDPRRTAGMGILRDLRRATTPVDAETVIGIIGVVRRFWPDLEPSRAAVLTPLAIDPAALVAHALADAHHIPLRTFTSYDEAVAWLREGVQQSLARGRDDREVER